MSSPILDKVQEIRQALEKAAQPLAENTPQVSSSSMLQMFIVELYSALREVYGTTNVSSKSMGDKNFSLLVRTARPEVERGVPDKSSSPLRQAELPEALITIDDNGMKITVWAGRRETQVEDTSSVSLRGLCWLSPANVLSMIDVSVSTVLQKYKDKQAKAG